jgi:hypothetical protein
VSHWRESPTTAWRAAERRAGFDDPKYGPAVRRKRFSSICRLYGLASMYVTGATMRPAPPHSHEVIQFLVGKARIHLHQTGPQFVRRLADFGPVFCCRRVLSSFTCCTTAGSRASSGLCLSISIWQSPHRDLGLADPLDQVSDPSLSRVTTRLVVFSHAL